jgi:hypothetical protein
MCEKRPENILLCIKITKIADHSNAYLNLNVRNVLQKIQQ